MNVLISSAAAKVLLVKAFQTAVRAAGGRVLTMDTQAICAAGQFSDQHLVVGRIDAPQAFDEIAAICAKHCIRLIVPTRDGELPQFSLWREAFRKRGVEVLVCPPAVLALCQDKRAFGRVIAQAGLQAVPEFDASAIPEWPVFVRPVVGAGGRGARRVDRREDLPEDVGTYLVHPLVKAKEYSIDLLMDLEGQPLQAVVRERQCVVSGESKVTTVVRHEAIEAASLKLGAALRLVGHNVVQAFDDPHRGILFIEVNPRFGGASNCSIVAGLASPERILGLIAGDAQVRQRRPIRNGLTMLRYSEDVFIEAAP